MDGRARPVTLVLDADLRPEDAAAALQDAGATRVVLAASGRTVSGDLLAALRRAGAEPFGIETVVVGGRSPAEVEPLLAAARAKLDALAPNERGRPTLNGGAFSRRALFSPGGALVYAPVAAVDEAACAGTVRCGLCIARCPENAIASTSPLPTVDPGACSACGLCVPRCPSGALRITGASTAQTEAQLGALLGRVLGVVLACREANADAPAGWALVELPTLALVTPGWVLQLRARGLEVRTAPCGDPHCAAVASAVALADRIPIGAAPERLCLAEPRATADAVRCLEITDVVESDTSPVGIVSIDATACTLCGACAAACPTDALQLDEDADETSLRLRPSACVACGRCAAACPEHVLGVRPGIDPVRLRRDSIELVWAPREQCATCGAVLPPRPMRRRLREMLPELSGAPLELCARCATRAAAGAAQDY